MYCNLFWHSLKECARFVLFFFFLFSFLFPDHPTAINHPHVTLPNSKSPLFKYRDWILIIGTPHALTYSNPLVVSPVPPSPHSTVPRKKVREAEYVEITMGLPPPLIACMFPEWR